MLPNTLPDVAVIVVVPTPTAVANPCEPGAVEMKATAMFDDVQATVAVRSCAVPSENVPRALNCSPTTLPRAIVGFDGVTVIDVSAAGETVSVTAFDVTPEKVAITVVVPIPAAVANPFVPIASLTVATCVLVDVHVAEAVMSFVIPLEYVPVAVNCCFAPMGMLAPDGVTEIDFRTAGVTVNVAGLEETPPNDAVI